MARKLPATVLACLVLVSSPAAAQEWLSIETDRFTVVSQLNERDTARWAREFDRFIDALGGLMPINEALLPPLTAVLFKRDGGFAPYRIRTESGVAGGNTGVFINYSTWSVIGMPGVRGSSSDTSTVFHEAVHWYTSADPERLPLWFGEGIAEVFSTFEVEGRTGRWGRPIGNNLAFLQTAGLQPMDEFLLVTQDEAMHVNATFYSQAWLFVHYLLIGRVMDGGPALLGQFLKNWNVMDPIEAFRASFDMEPREMDRALRSYLLEDRLNVAATELVESDFDYAVVPASEELVELSLARLAFGTGNEEPLSAHLARLAEVAPDNAAAYDLIAARKFRDGDEDLEAILDAAIARGSRDARTYELKAALRADAVRRSGPMFADAAFDPAEARRIANNLVSSANLRPLNRRVYTALADVLFSVGETLDYDRLVFENGSAAFPAEGVMLIGQAAIALRSGEADEARRLVGEALAAPYQLTADERAAARALRRRLDR